MQVGRSFLNAPEPERFDGAVGNRLFLSFPARRLARPCAGTFARCPTLLSEAGSWILPGRILQSRLPRTVALLIATSSAVPVGGSGADARATQTARLSGADTHASHSGRDASAVAGHARADRVDRRRRSGLPAQ